MMQSQLLGLDECHLVQLDHGPHRLTQACAAAFSAMQQAAAQVGFDLQAASSWRSFARQLDIWNGKWRGERPLLDSNCQPLEAAKLSDMERMHAILRWSALPGTSRHHWGTELDIYDPSLLPCGQKLALEPWEYERGGYFAPLSQWITDNMAAFGFFRPYYQQSSNHAGVAYEPWHLSFLPQSAHCKLDKQALADCLQQADIEGKVVILAQLDEILAHYVHLP